MKLQKSIAFLLFSIVVGLFYSCVKGEKNVVSKSDINYSKEEIQKARALFITPDSLRSPEEKVLFRQIIKAHKIKNGKIEIAVDKKEWERKGLPGIYYDILIMDVNDLNNFLDSVPISPSEKQIIFDSFREYQ
jgi:hypothetical protein